MLECCYCMIIPEDEYKRENTDDTIVPLDFIPVNENKHNNPFDTDLPSHEILQILDLQYGL